MRRASKEVTGIEFVPIGFPELDSAYDQADKKAAAPFAERWAEGAQKIIDVDKTEIEKAAVMYVAMKDVMAKHGARGISINCLGGFYGKHLKAFPCLGFCQFNDDGLIGACEADQPSAVTMAVIGAMTGRPGYISDPVIDTSRNAIIYAHCVAMTKPFGPDGESNAYEILTHSEDRKGASMRSFLPEGYMTTSLQMDPTKRAVVMHQAKTIGNNLSDMACRTKLEAEVKGDIEKLTENWRWGWHRVTFYGDLKEHIVELCGRLKLKVVEEA
jgi:L-fucose isomerase-like protein